MQNQRALAVSEKEQPGDGTADGSKVVDAAGVVARHLVVADFAAIAERHASVISASLLGALAASGALPFPRAAYEQAIRDGGVGIDASLKAFADAYTEAGRSDTPVITPDRKRLPALPASATEPVLDALLHRIRTEFPVAAHSMIYAGGRHLVDYQDAAYAGEYFDKLAAILKTDRAQGGESKSFALTIEVARQLARTMAYDDIIRVADLKTRTSRQSRVEREIGVDTATQVLQTTEYFHPRMQEVCGSLPAGIGVAIERRPWLFQTLDKLVNRGRRIRTDSIWGYVQLYLIAGRKLHRRATLRHGRELAHIKAWLASVTHHAGLNYDVATEIAKARRMIKGYSDTMSRGQSKYDRILQGAETVAARPDAADWVRRLRLAALLDEQGVALDGVLKTIASLEATTGSLPKMEAMQPAPATSDSSFEVVLKNSGQTFRIPPGQSILDVLIAAGVDPLHDCMRGECGVCQVVVLEGVPDHKDVILSESERAANKVMQICVSRSKSQRLVLDL